MSGCLCSFTSLLYPLRHILSCSQKLLISQLLFLYLIMLMSFLLLTSVKYNVFQNSFLRFSYYVRKYDHIYLRIIKDLAGSRFGNILFSTCLVFSVLHSSISGMSPWILSIISLLTFLLLDTKLVLLFYSYHIYSYIGRLNFVSLSPTPLSNILIPFLI